MNAKILRRIEPVNRGFARFLIAEITKRFVVSTRKYIPRLGYTVKRVFPVFPCPWLLSAILVFTAEKNINDKARVDAAPAVTSHFCLPAAFACLKTVSVLVKTVYVLTGTFHVLSKTVYVLTKTLHVLAKTVHVLGKTVHVLAKTLHVLEETFLVCLKTVHVLRKTFFVLRETVIAFVKTRNVLRATVHFFGWMLMVDGRWWKDITRAGSLLVTLANY